MCIHKSGNPLRQKRKQAIYFTSVENTKIGDYVIWQTEKFSGPKLLRGLPLLLVTASVYILKVQKL